MASTSQVQTGKAPKAAKPISAHPAFPAVVALWFAALLGLGSLILPVALIEQLVTATGIASAVPSAAPPLGFTGRLAIALVGTVIGAGLGLFIARKLSQPVPEVSRRRSFNKDEAPRRQPLSAHEDLGSASFDSVAGFATSRRRALAGEEEVRKSDFLHVAPLPGQRHEGAFAYAEHAETSEPLDLGDCAEFTEVQELPVQDAAVEEEFAMNQRQVFSLVPGEPESGAPLNFSPPSMARRWPENEPEEADYAEEAEAEAETQQEFMVPEPRQEFVQPEQEYAETPQEFVQPRQEFMQPEAAQAQAAAMPQGFAGEPTPAWEQDVTDYTAHQPIPAQAAGDADLVDLVHRLGATLERHREWSAQRSETAAAPRFPRAVVPTDFELAGEDEAAQGMAAFFADPVEDFAGEQNFAEPEARQEFELPQEFEPRQEFVPIPDAAAATQMRPFAGFGRLADADEDHDDELANIAASFSLPLGRASAAPAPVPVAMPEPEYAEAPAFADSAADEAVSEDDETAPDETFSSLLEMKNPFRDLRPEFVRVEEPEPEAMQPAVVFPHEVPSAPRAFDRPDNGTASMSFADRPTPARSGIAGDDNDRVLREALMNLQRVGKN